MLILRHIEATHNLEGTIGAADTDVTDRGIGQAHQLGAHFDGVDVGVIASSDRIRTRKSWDIPSGHYTIQSPCRIFLDGLLEVDMGEFSGLPVEESFAAPEIKPQVDKLGLDYAPPGGMSPNQAADLALRDLEAYPDISMVVSHSFLIKSLIGRKMGWTRQQVIDFKIANGEMIEFNPLHENPAPPRTVFKPTI